MWIADGWKDYEVIDTSCGEKLERWGDYLLVRPDPQVIWDTPKVNKGWKHMNGHYHRSKKGGGEWEDLTTAVNDVKMFNVSLSADELKAIFACKPEAIVRSNNNRLVAFFFSGLSSRGLITPNWQSVIANHKLFLSKDTTRDKYINQSDLSTATNYIRDVGVEGKYATLERYLMQVKRL